MKNKLKQIMKFNYQINLILKCKIEFFVFFFTTSNEKKDPS
jgi:hypothetical protein